MNSRIAVRSEANGIVVLIRPRPGHFITVIALCGFALLVILTGMSFFTVITAWGVPILGIFFFEIGEIIEIDASRICNVHVEEYGYKSKGGSYVSRALVFSSKSGVLAKSWQLSPEDGRSLIEGPFKRFINQGEVGCAS